MSTLLVKKPKRPGKKAMATDCGIAFIHPETSHLVAGLQGTLVEEREKRIRALTESAYRGCRLIYGLPLWWIGCAAASAARV